MKTPNLLLLTRTNYRDVRNHRNADRTQQPTIIEEIRKRPWKAMRLFNAMSPQSDLDLAKNATTESLAYQRSEQTESL